MKEAEKMKLAGYIAISSYRLRVLFVLNDFEFATPTKIAHASGIIPNHISKVLSELKKIGVVVCINEEARKGRVYTVTKKGQLLLPIALKLGGDKLCLIN